MVLLPILWLTIRKPEIPEDRSELAEFLEGDGVEQEEEEEQAQE
mgnify:CR=1 FL=1